MSYQPPVAAPLPFSALLAGARGIWWDGDDRERLRRWLVERHGVADALLTDSGTGALTLALTACLRERPGLVALPAYACYDLATALVGAGGRCAFYDLDPATLAPDPESLKRAVALGARTVVIVDLYGFPVDIAALGLPPDALVVDDAAQGVGATLRGRPLGAGGALGVLSFGRGKGMTAGAGGALLAATAHGAALLASVRGTLHAPARGVRPFVALKAQWLLGRPGLYGLAAGMPFLHLGETRYHDPGPVRELSAAGAAVLSVTSRLADEDTEVRRAHARRLLGSLGPGARCTAVRPAAGAEPGYLRLPVLRPEPDRRAVAAAAPLGIQPGYPAPLPDLPALRDRSVNGSQGFPGAATLTARLCTLPTHRFLSERDLLRLEAWLAG